MARKTPLSWEEHLDLGADLKDIHERLRKISMLVPNRVGKASKAASKAKAALKAVSGLKCELDSLVFEDFPEKGREALLDAYYGNAEDDAR
jgi:hypothetical protein